MLKKTQIKNRERQIRNKKYKTLAKNQLKKVSLYISSEKDFKLSELNKLVSEAQKALDKAAIKKVIHKNKASRKKSNLHRLVNKIIVDNKNE
jgi:small subunit ribosomal protein S20